MDNVRKIAEVLEKLGFTYKGERSSERLNGFYSKNIHQVIVDTFIECAGADLYFKWNTNEEELICSYNVSQDSLTEEEFLFLRMTDEIPYVRLDEFIKILEDLE